MLCIGYGEAKTDEGYVTAGSVFAETYPSPVRDASHRVHPLPQGERGSTERDKLTRRANQ
jgi:hypothetical protein